LEVVKMATRIGVYTLRIMGPEAGEDETSEEFDRRNQAVIDEISGAIDVAEGELSDMLPDGYYAKIEDA
jgi:hypothetical protein